MNYLTNVRDVRLLREDAGRATTRRFISRSELETDEKYIVRKNMSYSMAYRINMHTPIDVMIRDKWVHIGDMEVDGLKELYNDVYNPGYEKIANMLYSDDDSDKEIKNEEEISKELEDEYIDDSTEENDSKKETDDNNSNEGDHTTIEDNQKIIIRRKNNGQDNRENIIRNIHQMQNHNKK